MVYKNIWSGAEKDLYGERVARKCDVTIVYTLVLQVFLEKSKKCQIVP